MAQTRRTLFAKQLIQNTRMPMSGVAAAAGFGSVRRFNATFQKLYGRSPSALRRSRQAEKMGGPLELVIGYHGQYDWDALLQFLAARAVAGVEAVANGRYRRTVEAGGQHGIVEVRHVHERRQLAITICFPDVRALPALLRRVCRVFDTRADITTVEQHLATDPLLAPLVAQRPGLRTPGGWDNFELAVRAMLGQQITVQGAQAIASRMAADYGVRLQTADTELTRLFPAPRDLADADLTTLGIPRARAASLSALARAVVGNPELFARGQSLDEAVARLRALPGIGEWTAQYIALRALRETDAFPASDVGLLRSLSAKGDKRCAPAELLARAEAWRPWRAYAAQHLWTHDVSRTTTI